MQGPRDRGRASSMRVGRSAIEPTGSGQPDPVSPVRIDPVQLSSQPAEHDRLAVRRPTRPEPIPWLLTRMKVVPASRYRLLLRPGAVASARRIRVPSGEKDGDSTVPPWGEAIAKPKRRFAVILKPPFIVRFRGSGRIHAARVIGAG